MEKAKKKQKNNKKNYILQNVIEIINDDEVEYFINKETSLQDRMAFDFSSVKVSGIDEKDYTIEQSGNGWILKSKGDYALPFGKTITV